MRAIDDMYFAAALLAYNLRLLSVDQTDPKRFKFNFSEDIKRVYLLEDGVLQTAESPSIDEVETFFVSRILLFPPSYPDAVKRIKAFIHSR